MDSPLLRQIPGWQRWPWLSAGFSQRFGGVSQGFGDVIETGLLNLGFVLRDDPERVEENRRRLLRAVDGANWKLVVARQVHGVAVRTVTQSNAREAMLHGHGQWEADGLVTADAGLLLGAGSADCVPVLVADLRQRAVGAFHAGWRGTAAGVVERGMECMRDAFTTRAEDCIAAIGPSIGVCCYEVGEEVSETVGKHNAVRAEGRPGKWRLNLSAANWRQLQEAGVPAAAITDVGECTACSRDPSGQRRYFSHRAEGGVTGRMLAVVGVRSDMKSI